MRPRQSWAGWIEAGDDRLLHQFVRNGGKEPFGRSKIDAEDIGRAVQATFCCEFGEFPQGIASLPRRPKRRQSSGSLRGKRDRTSDKAPKEGPYRNFCRWRILGKDNVAWQRRRNRFRVTPAVMRLSRMPARRRLVPAEDLIVIFCVTVADLRVVSGTPDVTLYSKGLLPKLIDQSREGPQQTLFHGCSQWAETLGVGLIFFKDGRQTHIPFAQDSLLRVRNVAQVGLRHPRDRVGWCQGIQKRQCIVGDNPIQTIRKSAPKARVARK